MHSFTRKLAALCAVFSLSVGFASHEARDFNHLTEENIADINYIIKSLGSKSLVSIGFAKSKLRKAGGRVHVVHPIRYILHILSDSELTFNLCALRERGWIWDGYLHGESGDDGFLDSLQQEYEAGGIQAEHVRELAQTIGVGYEYLQQITDTCHWERMMQLIMHHAIKKVKYNPYDDV